MQQATRRSDSRITESTTPLTLTRRAALALPVLALAACSSAAVDAPATRDGRDAASATPSTENEAALIAQYDEVMTQYPQLAATLAPVRDQHRAHLVALGGSPTSLAAPPTRPRAGSARAAVATLAEAEKQAAQLRLTDCLAATEGPLARTLALIAASEAAHVALLVDA